LAHGARIDNLTGCDLVVPAEKPEGAAEFWRRYCDFR
jgi:hypothetical protein